MSSKKNKSGFHHTPFKVIFFFLILILSLWFTYIVGNGLQKFYYYYTANFDGITTGKVVSVRRHWRYRNTSARVVYAYKVDDRLYKSNILSFGGAHETPAWRKYPVNKIVKVHYDSANPQAATLFVDKISLGLWFALVSMFGMVLLCSWLFYPKKLVKKLRNLW